jgi:hypothetical protein
LLSHFSLFDSQFFCGATFETGIGIGDWIQDDPDFESLRDHPRFQAIMKRIAPSPGS